MKIALCLGWSAAGYKPAVAFHLPRDKLCSEKKKKKKDSGLLSVMCVVVICSLCTNESDYVELNEPVMQLLVSLTYFKQADRSLQLTQDVKQSLLLVQLLPFLHLVALSECLSFMLLILTCHRKKLHFIVIFFNL